MTYRCAACGTQFENGTDCPRCGRPVSQPVPPAPPPPPPPPSGVAAPAPRPAAAGSTRGRVLKAAGIGVLALLVVAGSAFAAIQIFSPGGALPLPQASGATTQLTVTGEPPKTTGSWASGVRRVWRIDGEHPSGIEDDTEVYLDPGNATDQAWTATDFVGDTTLVYTGLDPATGKTLWTGKMFRDCAAEQSDGLVPCFDWVKNKTEDSWDPAVALVNWRTGKSKSVTKLSDLGLDDNLTPLSEIAVRGGALVLTLPDYPDGAGDYLGDLAGVTVAKVSANGRELIWHTRVGGCDGCDRDQSRITAANLQHGVLTTTFGAAFDFDTGKSLFPDSSYVVPIADGVLDVITADGGGVASDLTAPDGTTMSVVSERGGWRLDGTLPPQPLRITTGKRSAAVVRATVTAFDPRTGAAAWQTPVQLSMDANELSFIPVEYDGSRLLFLSDDEVLAADASTGATLWKRKLTGGSFFDTKVASDGTILAYGYETTGNYTNSTAGLDPDSGAVLWTISGIANPVPGPDGESLIVVNSQFNSPYVARFDPADRPSTTPVVPADAPDCPSGMTAISWTQYTDGAILLCRLDQAYAVVFPAHQDWVPAELNFSAGGHEVVFTNGTKVRVSLGGRVVTTEADGTVTAQPVTSAWNDAAGRVKGSVPSDLRTCPAGSWPISLSTYQGGWLLVCGTAADAPTSMLLSTGTDVTDVSSVTYRNGGYCGTAPSGTVCGYRSPAVVSVTAPDGTVTQHSADSNYFDGHGAGGTGKGNGSYGVETPDDNAKDQVRYLTEILQKSMAGRTNLQSAVDRVRTCSDMDGAISSFNDVLANRQELLDALDSAPVDAVPDGQVLAARLRNALQLSHDSDGVWLQWAQAEQANGCADGQKNPLYQQVRSMNGDVAVAKQQFLTMWNHQIAPTYRVRTFKVSQI